MARRGNAQYHSELRAHLERQFEQLRNDPSLRARRLEYEVREDGVVVVKVRDAETDKVILTVPPEEQLELARRLEQYFGRVLDETA